MKKFLSLFLSCAVVLSSVFLFNISSSGVNETTLDEFSADISEMISEYGLEPLPLSTESADLYCDADSDFETCRLIVKSNQKVDPLDSVATAGSFNGLQIFQFENPQDARTAYEYYISLDCVEFAEPDKIITVSDTETETYPYDYKTAYLSWGPKYIGFDELNNYIVENKISLSPVKVAIIDSGIHHNRAEFANRIEDTFFNNSESGQENSTADDNGHGTFLASVIVDCTFSNVIIRPYKTFNSKGKSSSILIANALFKVAEDGCDIINMSFGQFDENFTVLSAVNYVHENTDIIMTAAIGNEGTSDEEVMPTPAISEHVIAVSAINQSGNLSKFSNYNKKYVELTAPGERIKGLINHNSAFSYRNGTSLATPFVSSVAAAVLSLNPSLSAKDVRTLLSETAVPMFTDRQKLGFFGNGLVYAMGALQALPDVQFAEAPTFSHKSGKYENSIEITITAQDGAQIYYTTDGTIPTENSNLYDGEITVDSETGILAVAYVDGKTKSPVSSALYRIVENVDSSELEVDDNGYILSYSGNASDIRIPESAKSVSGKQVTIKGIGESAFENNLYLISVALPNTVTDFRSNAFYGCENLEEINFSSATNIGDCAFYNCKSLKSINIPKVITIGSYAFFNAGTVDCAPFSISSDRLISIGEGAFTSTPITHFYAPNATGELGDSTFKNCELLIEFYMPYAERIGNEAFAGCKNLTDCVADCAAEVGDKAFLNCENIKSISLEAAKSIGSEAFHGCTKLSAFSLPAVKTIYYDCFKDAPETVTELVLPSLETIFEVEGASFPSSLTSFYAPNLKNIPANAFKNNAALSEVTLGNAESIGEYAFYNCSAITEIDLSTVKSIGKNAFYNCSGLTEVDLSSLQKLGAYGFCNCSQLSVFDMPELLEMGAYSIFGTKINYLSAPKATTVSQNALIIPKEIYPIKIDLSSLKKITFYNFLSYHRCYFILSSLEEGEFYAGGPVYYPSSSGATCPRKAESAPKILKTSNIYGYSYMPESAKVPDVLYVSAVGLNLTYQWYSNSSASLNGASPIDGAVSPELDLLTAPDSQYYFCKVTMNDNGTVSSVNSSFVKNESFLGGAERADYSSLLAVIESIPSDLSNYTEGSVELLNSLVNEVEYNLTSAQQAQVDNLAGKISSAIDSLTFKAADYSGVENELSKIPTDLSIYTPQSVAAVEYAVQSVTYGLNIQSQPRVNCMAMRVADKLSRLEIAPADYSELDALISSVPNLEIYTEESVDELNAVIASINRNLLITEQSKVEEYIKAVKNAIDGLKLKNENYIKLEELISSVPKDLSIYTDNTVTQLKNTLDEIESGINTADSQQIDEYLNRLSKALDGLELKTADYSAVNSAISAIPEDLSIYTEDSVANLNAAVDAVEYNLDITQQEKVNSFARDITNATENLKLKAADYSAVNSAISAIPQDLSIYTEDSVANLNAAVDAVEYNLDITQQEKVNSFATNIINATENLKLKSADYSAVNSAISAIPEDLSIYTEDSVANLNVTVNAVEYNLDITQQEKINSFATNIRNATENLKLKAADYSAVNSAISAIPQDLSIYTDESVANLNATVNAVEYNLDITQQEKINSFADAIKKATDNLRLKAADYSVVNSAISAIPEDLSIYTEDSVAELKAAVDAVEYNLDITQQEKVNSFATNIINATENLKLKAADYSAVNSAISAIPEDLSIYTEDSVANLNAAVDAVEYNLDITQQEKVNSFASDIRNATENLKLKAADYSAVNSAISAIPEDLSIYTDESVANLNAAVDAVEYNLDITQQETVNGFADLIEKAVAALSFKKADLSGLNNAIALVPADLSVYTEESVAALESVLNGIDYELAETNQEYADRCADSVKIAVENLEVEHWFIRLIKSIIRFFKNLFDC